MCSDLASDFVAMWIYVGLRQKNTESGLLQLSVKLNKALNYLTGIGVFKFFLETFNTLLIASQTIGSIIVR